jgi:hypothetical protein
MAVFTVDDIISRAKDAADMHDLFVKPTTWINWFNVELQALFVMCARGGWTLRNFTFKSFSVPTDLVSGAFLINNEFLAIVGVWEIDGSGRMRQLKATNGIDNMRQFPGATAATGHPRSFWLTDFQGTVTEQTQIVLYPTPTSGNFIVAICNGPTKATATTDTTTLPLGIEEWVVLRMARRALIKEESETGSIDKLIESEERKMEEYIWNRNLGSSAKVRNVDSVERGWVHQYDLVYPDVADWIWG